MVVELPCDVKEAVELGREWFDFCLGKIKQGYPGQMLYFEETICRKFGLAEYKKRWITWYFLWEEIWEEVKERYHLQEEELEVVFCDTMDERAYLLFQNIISCARRIQVVTACKERWLEIQENTYEEKGIIFEIVEELEGEQEQKLFVDVDGGLMKKYGRLSQNNWILALGICREQREYLRYRIKGGNVVVGMEQTISGETVNNKFASVYMQSMVWKIRQLAETKESFFEKKELKDILEQYDWHVQQLEVM